MYELIIFTLMASNVQPLWIHLEPTSEVVCIERKIQLEEMFEQIDNLAYSLDCKRVEEKKDD